MSGYSGRVGLFELVPITSKIRQMITEKVSEVEMTAECLRMGIIDLRDQGRNRVIEGATTIEEVLRVTEEKD